MNIIIRNETEADIEAISEVTKAAFENHPISNHTEQFIVNALRAPNALTVSLVAEINGKVVGHIAFSPVTISNGSKNWYGVGPVSVLPDFQRKGVGKSLVREGLSLLKASGAQGCVLVGDPKHYERGLSTYFGLARQPRRKLRGMRSLFRFMSTENGQAGNLSVYKSSRFQPFLQTGRFSI